MTKTAVRQTTSQSLPTLRTLFDRAATYKGLKLVEEWTGVLSSEPIKVYKLDEPLLAILAANGFHRRERHVDTLVDMNRQDWPGTLCNFWEFPQGEDPQLELVVWCHIDKDKSGVETRQWPVIYRAHAQSAGRL